jgi:nicotinate phosphoribosyltransferase
MTPIAPIGPLFTDLYELTMAAAYFDHGVESKATFSLFIRDSKERNFFVAAGLEDVIKELQSFHFSGDDIQYLKATGLFTDDFIAYLKKLHFTGDIYAMAEGTVFFPNEPVLEVTAPVIEAQIVETFLLNTIGFQTMIATKAARCIHAAAGRPLIDFSLRRTQGQDAGLKVARSTYIVGFTATSNVLAGKIYGIPISGTMAHSFISAFDSEKDAFSAYGDTFPENSVFLIDTFDTLAGAHHAVKVAKKMQKKGKALKGIRLDSGDMADLSQKVRKVFDDAGFPDVKIFASSGFDEFKISSIIAAGGKIDAFGVGTKVGVSADAPYLDVVYKLVRFKDRDIRKLSPGKITLSGEKQVFRKTDNNGYFLEDIIGVRAESVEGADHLLTKVMAKGKSLMPPVSLQDIQNRFKKSFSLLDEKYKSIRDPETYPVKLSRRLTALQNKS